MKRTFVLFAALTAAAVALLAASSASAASTLNVDNTDALCGTSGHPYCTIKAAVAAASSGDTIVVAAGTYSDQMIQINVPLTLEGAQAGNKADSSSARSGGETILSYGGGQIFRLNATGITIDGFDFSNIGSRAIDSYGNTVDNLTISDNIFKGIMKPSTGDIQLGGGGQANNFTFEGNYVQTVQSNPSAAGNMLYLGDTMTGGMIKDNYINGDYFAFGPFAGAPVDGWTVEGNTFDGNVPGQGAYAGFGMNSQFGNAVIKDNYVHQMNGGLGAISVVDGSITGNTFDDNKGAAFALWGGQYSTPVSANDSIENNLIKYNGTSCTDYTDASHGIWMLPTVDASTLQIHNNSFVDLGVGTCGEAWAIGRDADTGTAADATRNYWGATDSASIGAMIGNGSANYTPWISAYTDDPAHAGGNGFWPLFGTFVPSVVSVGATPQYGKSGTAVALSSEGKDPNGLTDVYYNLFDANTHAFVCTVGHNTVAGFPTDTTDTGWAPTLPFAGLHVTNGIDCPGGGIPEGNYLVTANWENLFGSFSATGSPTLLSSYSVTTPLTYDNTPPVLAPTVTPNPIPYGGSATAAANATDSLSGVASQSCDPLDTTTPGTHTVDCTATDKAGNVGNGSTTYTVASPLKPGKTICDGLYSGSGKDVEVPKGATCTLMAGTHVSHDVKVGKGGTLVDNGATIGHDLHADGAAGVTVDGGSIGHDVHVNKTTGGVTVENAHIGHDLHVEHNQGGVTVTNNHVGHDMHVQDNSGPTVVSDNTAGHDANCRHNGGQTGTGNTAGHKLACPA